MPFARIDGVRLHYDTQGSEALPCLVLSNSLGTDLSMWERQATALAEAFHVVRYDTRGHGQSDRCSAPLDVARLGQDVIGLLDHLGIGRAHFCGISMGGLTGQWLAIHAPQRIDKLALADTAARIGNAEGWTARAALVRREGIDRVADGAASRWFTDDFIVRQPEVVRTMIGTLRAQDSESYAACCDALADCDLCDAVTRIGSPTLVLAGVADPVATVADAHWLAGRIDGARVEVLPASHLSNVEAGERFTGLLGRFLSA